MSSNETLVAALVGVDGCGKSSAFRGALDMIHDWSFDASGTAVWWVQRADAVYWVTVQTHES